MKNILKFLIPLPGIVAVILVTACADTNWQTIDSGAIAALAAINGLTKAAIDSGALPAGKTTDIVNDANTISAALETIATGAPITTDQAKAVATSFKSNSATASYASLVPIIVNPIVKLVQAKIASGASTADVQAAQVQAIANAPAAVQAATLTVTAPSAYQPAPLVPQSMLSESPGEFASTSR